MDEPSTPLYNLLCFLGVVPHLLWHGVRPSPTPKNVCRLGVGVWPGSIGSSKEAMNGERHGPEQIIHTLRQAEIEISKGVSVSRPR